MCWHCHTTSNVRFTSGFTDTQGTRSASTCFKLSLSRMGSLILSARRKSQQEREAGGESQRKSKGGGEESDFWTGEQSTVKMIFTILRHILEIVLDIMI